MTIDQKNEATDLRSAHRPLNPGDVEVLMKEAEMLHHRRLRRRWVVGIVIALVVSLVAFGVGRGGAKNLSSPSTATNSAKQLFNYKFGETIPGSMLAGVEMFTTNSGVAIAPMLRSGYPIVNRYLTRTRNGGSTWQVSGVFPRGFYPEQLTFESKNSGYVLGQGGPEFTTEILYTANAGRTWSKVVATRGEQSINSRGGEVWVEADDCSSYGMAAVPCIAKLDTYTFGRTTPSSVVRMPVHQSIVDQVSATAGYSFAGQKSRTDPNYSLIYFTTNSGATWTSTPTPCPGAGASRIDDAVALSPSTLMLTCLVRSANNDTVTLHVSINGGRTWVQQAGATLELFNLTASANGRYLWAFRVNGKLYRSVNLGRSWTEVPGVSRNNIDKGIGNTDSRIATLGGSSTWYAMLGRGVYRTLNGKVWTLFS